MIISIPLSRIHPNPWQTRQGDPDPAYIKDLALDIAANGLLQTPIGRMIDVPERVSHSDPVMILAEFSDVTIQLAFGHNRLAAYKWLNDVKDHSNLEGDWTTMPVDLRTITDEQMATMAWSENEKRRDHTPLERALAIQRRMTDFGWTQSQAAEALGVSRPVVSNALRLLKLPPEITDAITDGRISERVAMAIASYFDLPQAIKDKAAQAWDSPEKMVKAALAGQLTSDGVRDKINLWCLTYGEDLAKAPFSLDDPFMIPDVVAPFCRDCEQRFKDRNICLDRDCYKLKLNSFRQAALQRAADDCGIPPHDDQNASSYEYASFRYGAPDGALETIIAGKCPNLRLLYRPGSSQLPGHPDAEVVCSKRGQYCTCLAGLRVSQPTTTFSYDFERHESIPLTDPALVQLATDQPTAEDLKNAAQQARREKRQLEQEKQAVLQEASERIAVGLTHGSLQTWKWLAGKVYYSLRDTVAPMDNTFDVRHAIVHHLISGQTYPDSLAKVIRNFNEDLAQCGLDLIESPAAHLPAPEDPPPGATLVEIFAREEAESEVCNAT